MSHGAVATAYLHRSADLPARTAALLGHPADEARYRRIVEGARVAWQCEYLSDDGTVTPDTQVTLVRALAFGLVLAPLRTRTADRLAALIRAAGTHLSIGFLSTGLLLPVLAETGHLGLTYELLRQATAPSWLTATPAACEAGYRRFVIARRPGGGLSSASARHESPHGLIASQCHLHDGEFTLTTRIPPGTEAEIRLPGADTVTAGPGTHTYTIDMCHEDS